MPRRDVMDRESTFNGTYSHLNITLPNIDPVSFSAVLYVAELSQALLAVRVKPSFEAIQATLWQQARDHPLWMEEAQPALEHAKPLVCVIRCLQYLKYIIDLILVGV